MQEHVRGKVRLEAEHSRGGHREGHRESHGEGHGGGHPMAGPVDRIFAIETLEGVLTPHIGPHMARASVRAHCQQLELEDESRLEPQQIEDLIHRLGLGMAVLVGRERAGEVVEAMRGAIGVGGAA